jgi:preprotein translocase subunit SecD
LAEGYDFLKKSFMKNFSMKKPLTLSLIAIVLLFTSCMNGPTVTGTTTSLSETSGESNRIVEVRFAPANSTQATPAELDSYKTALEKRMADKDVSNIDLAVNYGSSVITVQFETKSDEADVKAMIVQLNSTNWLTFKDEKDKVLLDGADVENARSIKRELDTNYSILITLTADGAAKFAEATKINMGRTITLNLGSRVLASPRVNTEIADGHILISDASFTALVAQSLADDINTGARPIVRQVGDVQIMPAGS